MILLDERQPKRIENFPQEAIRQIIYNIYFKSRTKLIQANTNISRKVAGKLGFIRLELKINVGEWVFQPDQEDRLVMKKAPNFHIVQKTTVEWRRAKDWNSLRKMIEHLWLSTRVYIAMKRICLIEFILDC